MPEQEARFCAKTYTKPEILELTKKILLIPDLYNEVEKYIKAQEPDRQTQLKKLKRHAYQKWHTDINKNPQAEFYAKCIAEALDIFELITKEPERFTDPINRTVKYPEEEPEIPITEMQEKLRNAIDEILQKAEKTTETIEIDKSILYSEIIEEEQQSRIYDVSLYALIFYGIIGSFILEILKQNILHYPVAFIYYTLIFICTISIIPFSRYWLFKKIPYLEDIQLTIINIGSFLFQKFMNWVALKLANKAKTSKSPLLLPAILLYWWIRLLLFIFGLIMFVLYEIALKIAGTKTFKSLKKQQTFYDGVADWYIYEIISKQETELTEQEKDIIWYFYKKYI